MPTQQLWCAGYLTARKLVLVEPAPESPLAPLLACVPMEDGQLLCLEAFKDDETGHILIDFGMEQLEDTGSQGGEGAKRLDLDCRPMSVTLNLSPPTAKAAAGYAERRASPCPKCHTIYTRVTTVHDGWALCYCEECGHPFQCKVEHLPEKLDLDDYLRELRHDQT